MVLAHRRVVFLKPIVWAIFQALLSPIIGNFLGFLLVVEKEDLQ